MTDLLNLDSAKAYATKITQGVATYARHEILDGIDMVNVRVRLSNFHVCWMSVWTESRPDGSQFLYGEY